MKERTDTERLDFLIQHSYCGLIDMELRAGRRTSVKLGRTTIDNAMRYRRFNIESGQYDPPKRSTGTQGP